MSILNIVKTAKEVHKTVIVMVKIGKFYQVYGKDAYIISYMFDYKLRKVNNNNLYSSAFPKKYISKIKSKIEKYKIYYILIDVRNNYEVFENYHKKFKVYTNFSIYSNKLEYNY